MFRLIQGLSYVIDLGPSCLEWTNLPDESGIACDIGLSRLHASNKLTEIASNITIQAKISSSI